MTLISNDNDETTARAVVPNTDGQGEAAVLLVESLIHGLIERSVITVEDAVEIANTAAEAKTEMSLDLAGKPARLRNSLTILESISCSLLNDVRS